MKAKPARKIITPISPAKLFFAADPYPNEIAPKRVAIIPIVMSTLTSAPVVEP